MSPFTRQNHAWVDGVSPADTLTPADRYEELFVAVQTSRVFDDSKTFVDCVPQKPPEEILRVYRSLCHSDGFELKAFVEEHFAEQKLPPDCFVSNPDQGLDDHIESLWSVLTRQPRQHPVRSSLLPLPEPYLVPGGRFTEMYYWDSYFTMLGLRPDRHAALLRSMVDNFAHLIDAYGRVPNGNRTYYLSRSQPPFFSMMLDLLAKNDASALLEYLPRLRKEYAFWMDGAEDLRPGDAHARCLRMPNGTVLNRYWDDRDSPREESYVEDVATAQRAKRPVHDVYRDLRAGAESGWDFSSRWQDDPADLATIRTTTIVPVDLNCLVFKLEAQIARLSEASGEAKTAQHFRELARRRCAAIDEYSWDARVGAYFDYDWLAGARRSNLTAATVTPLFVGCASKEQAAGVAKTVRSRLLADGGLSTTETDRSTEQWDRPNGWAPLQWMAVSGLREYGEDDLAAEIRRRWLDVVAKLYRLESKLVEKYVMRKTVEHAQGGEYPLQDGFGWTNGVVARFLREEPDHEANRCRAGAP